MAVSSTGIGSGLDVTSIITQLTALEKIPLNKLQSKATDIQAKLSTVGQIKSQVSALSDAAFKLTLDGSWNGTTVSSSNPSAVTGTVTGVAAATTFSLEVSQLAKAQSTASTAVVAGASMGTGTLTIDLGTWNHGTPLVPIAPPVFSTPSSTVSVSIGVGEDSLATIASKINDANAGVTATVLKDSSGERLLIRSKSTGEESGFRITVADDDTVNTDNAGLSRLAFDPGVGAFGMAANTYSRGQNAQGTINSIAVTSATNSLAGAIAGLTLQFSAITTAPVEVSLTADKATVNKNIQDFVTAYNTLNKSLSDATKYDAETKTAGVLQGDATAVGLKSALLGLMGSSSVGSSFGRLAEVGLEIQLGGAIVVSGSKLTSALANLDNLKTLFTANNSNPLTNGFGLKVKDFARGLLATEGTVTTKTAALEAAATRNTKEQDKVNARVALVEARLKKQYSALDAKMGSLTALNSYVTQQIALWNRSTG